MKCRSIFLSVLLLASCSKGVTVIEELPELPSEAIAEATLNIAIRTGNPSKNGFVTSFDYEDKINSLQLLIFDSVTGSLNFYQNLGTAVEGSARLYLGDKTLYVLANGPSLSGVSTLKQLREMTYGLKEYNTESGMIMMATEDITLKDDESVTLYLDRMLSRIYVASVENGLPAAYGGIKVVSAFLGNVPSAIGSFGDYVPAAALTNAGGLPDNPVYGFTCRTLSKDVSSGGSSTIAVPLYSYTNGSESADKKTFVSLKASVGGEYYYYTIYLDPAHLKMNSTSDIQLKIVGLGTKDPSEIVEKSAVTYDIIVREWQFASSYSETI